ncbi:hypothetical protein CPC08DRAFT_824471 [Agrocybe pediades]|nr:hypothetical protein CPC08DRAFT_824471 [Agrocybe pediades]
MPPKAAPPGDADHRSAPPSTQGARPSPTPAPSSVAGSRQSTPGPQNPERLRSVSAAPSDVLMDSTTSQPIDEDQEDQVSSGSATPAKRSRQSSPARDQQDQPATFTPQGPVPETFIESFKVFRGSLDRGLTAIQRLQDMPGNEAYVASIPDAEGFVRTVFALADRIRDIPHLAAQIPATTGDWSSFTNYFASAGGSGTLFNEGQGPSTPPPIDNDGDITLDPQTPKPKRTDKGKGQADPPAGPGPSRSGQASNAPPQESRPSGPRPLPNPPVAPRQQPKKPEIQFARVGPPPPINKATKPKKSYASTLGQGPKRPVTIAQVAKVMPQLPLEAVAGPSGGQASGPSNARKYKHL